MTAIHHGMERAPAASFQSGGGLNLGEEQISSAIEALQIIAGKPGIDELKPELQALGILFKHLQAPDMTVIADAIKNLAPEVRVEVPIIPPAQQVIHVPKTEVPPAQVVIHQDSRLFYAILVLIFIYIFKAAEPYLWAYYSH